MMDGRVKTLHPAVHGGILARRDRPDDLAAIAAQGIRPVDLVVVNLYPFAKAAANADTPFDGLVEEIDIGGPSLVRAAAKNFRDVLVVVDPGGLPACARRAGPRRRPVARVPLRADAQGVRAHRRVRHDDRRRRWLTVDVDDGAMTRQGAAEDLLATRRALRYGENPHQEASWQVMPESMGRTWQVHQGQGAVVHEPARSRRRRSHRARVRRAGGASSSSTPIRAASRPGTSPADAYVRAREADPLSAFGGIVGLNRPLDAATAAGADLDVHRGGDRAGGGRRGAGDSGEEGEHARGHGRFQRAGRTDGVRRLRSALVPRRHADAGARSRRRSAQSLARRRSAEGRHEACAHRIRVDGAALRVARLRARQVERGHLHRAPIARSPSAPGR